MPFHRTLCYVKVIIFKKNKVKAERKVFNVQSVEIRHRKNWGLFLIQSKAFSVLLKIFFFVFL